MMARIVTVHPVAQTAFFIMTFEMLYEMWNLAFGIIIIVEIEHQDDSITCY